MADPRPDPHVLVVFGARGDLAARKLFPGLFRLRGDGADARGLPRSSARAATRPTATTRSSTQVREALDEHGPEELDEDAWTTFAERLSFVASSADDAQRPGATRCGRPRRSSAGTTCGACSTSACRPAAMEAMVGPDRRERAGRAGAPGHGEAVRHRPGERARSSTRRCTRSSPRTHVFRIDHFLGKEAAQNVLAVRFANGLFEPIWNRDHIASVQIDVPEELGLEGRGAFYEETGAFRDMIVTHLFQLLGFVAMEPPVAAGRGPRCATRRPSSSRRCGRSTRRGSSSASSRATATRRTSTPDSTTESFAAVRGLGGHLALGGRAVPAAHRQGDGRGHARHHDRLPRAAAADVRPRRRHRRRRPPRTISSSSSPTRRASGSSCSPRRRARRSRSSPRRWSSASATADDGDERLEAYERLLHDVMLGDHTLFTRADEVERLWEVAAPVLETRPTPEPYAQGSWGPEAALALPPAPGWRLGAGVGTPGGVFSKSTYAWTGEHAGRASPAHAQRWRPRWWRGSRPTAAAGCGGRRAGRPRRGGGRRRAGRGARGRRGRRARPRGARAA